MKNAVMLMDRSGSMASILNDTIGGINTYWDTLKESPGAGEIQATLVTFDSTSIDTVFKDVQLTTLRQFTGEDLKPRDSTPLIEAAIKTIEAVRADQAFLIIVTDGEENSSKREYTRERLAALIAAKRALGWEFIFLGASFDNYGESKKMGIGAANTMSYDALDKAATKSAYTSAARSTMDSFAGGSASFSASDKLAAGDKFAPQPAVVPDQVVAQPTPAVGGKATVAAEPLKDRLTVNL